MADLRTTVLADRVVDPGAGDWSPEVWLIDAASAGTTCSFGTGAGGGRGWPVGPRWRSLPAPRDSRPPAGPVIDVDEDGMLSLPALLGEQRVHAAGMDSEALAGLLELFDCAGHFEQTRADAWPGTMGARHEHSRVAHPGRPGARR